MLTVLTYRSGYLSAELIAQVTQNANSYENQILFHIPFSSGFNS